MTPVSELSIHCYRHHFFFLFPQLALGLGTAAGVRVGNELGAGRPLKAKRVTYTAIGIMCMRDIVYSVATKMATFSARSSYPAVCTATIMTVVLIASRKVIGKLFTKDE